MATDKRVLVVGGDAAGMSAALQVRRFNPGLQVVVCEKGPHVSYGACGLPYFIAGEIPQVESLLAMTPQQVRERGVELRLQTEVKEIRAASRIAELAGPDGRTTVERYDYLVLATGGNPVVPAWEGAGLPQVFTLRNLADGIALRLFLEEQKPARAVVVGAGFLGLELVEALLKRGLQVTVLERSERILSSFEPEFAAPVLEALRGKGAQVVLGAQVQGIAGTGQRVEAVHSDAGTHPADLVLLALGLRPGTALAQRAGVKLGRTGAIAVNDRMKTETAGVYAAGDCVETFHVVSGEKVFVPLALLANRTGRIAGANLAAEAMGQVSNQRFRGTAATLIAQVCGFALARTGLDLEQAGKAGFDPAVFRGQGRSRAAYYPGGSELDLRIVVDRQTRRLLGAQMLGREGVAGRIDVLATALFKHMTVDEIYHLDLAYAPPFGPVYDPVVSVCGKASLEV